MAYSYLPYLSLFFASALGSQQCISCTESQAPSILQKDSRVQRLVKDASQDIPTLEAPPEGGYVRWHWFGFLTLVVGGSLANYIFQRLPHWLSMLSARNVSKDVIREDNIQRKLSQNSHLLSHIEAPTPVASFLDLLPDSVDAAMCRDGASPDAVSYRDLRALLQDGEIAAFFTRSDRVGIVLENGKEMAMCLLTVMHHACAVPLNPNFTEAELLLALEQLKCSVLVTAQGHAAQAAGRELGLRILLLKGGQCGATIQLEGERALSGEEGPADLHRTVLLLKTSGTTSKGKVVPFSMRRLSLAAQYNARGLELQAKSVCLSMMPLYHIAGISVNFLASLTAGATVLFFSGQFDVCRFVAEVERDEHRPTWYFAVPAVHEAVLKHVSELGRPVKHSLKVIRSAGAAISDTCGHKLIETFQCAVTPAYGMTEALEITCPPASYKMERSGSVGPSVSAEIQVLDGEVCVRGDLVMEGYEHEGAAADDPNGDAWTGGEKGKGFLRTGDLGHLDEDGWLYLTGRCKEMINRGGETINPHEVEPALSRVPGVALAICFSAPHQALGECIGAALVLNEGGKPSEVQPKDILRHCEKQLSEVMQPEVFVYLPKHLLPTTATKKFIRAGLAQRLGLLSVLDGQGGAFQYENGSFTACNFLVDVPDSLGQLREANAKEAAEQRLKDAMFGVGILQVMMKHWFEGKFPVDDWAGWFPLMTQLTESHVYTMTLFFMLSGHTSSLATSWSSRRHRWASIYCLMVLASIQAIFTKSMRVDWFFLSLLIMEVAIALTAECGKLLSPPQVPSLLVGATTMICCILLAAWSGVANCMTSSYFPYVTSRIGWDVTARLTETWGNMLFGCVDFQFGFWPGSMVYAWAAAFSFGFYFLPLLSKAIWSRPQLLLLLSRIEVRLVAFLFCYSLLYLPRSDSKGTDVARMALGLVQSGSFVAAASVAVGSNGLFCQLGRCAMGALLTHTMFGTKYGEFGPLQHEWTFHDTLQLSELHEQPLLVGLFLFTLPALYVLSVGQWVQAALDRLLCYPLSALPIWLCFVWLYDRGL